MEDEHVRINWKVNDRIRNKETGHPFLVLHVSRHYCTIIDLESKDQLIQPLILLPRDFGRYAKDHEMDLVKKNNSLEWVYSPIYL